MPFLLITRIATRDQQRQQVSQFFMQITTPLTLQRKRRYLGRYFAHPMMQNRRAKRDDYKSSAVRVTQRYVP
ncbi:hypothetical protein [Piscirickettsia salmonis]|uniref:hypothetical protein n=1 Tax=Piscirickettsia salmonis TaxID=1238 RepID=UPI0012BAEFAE|nr:hypothetical protein [Piscirickettsia salmonis]